jgi:hypothetical protein
MGRVATDCLLEPAVMKSISVPRASWFGLLWSAGASVVVALTIQAVPALVIPVLASALLVVAGRSNTLRRTLGVFTSLTLMVFIGLGMLSVGWYYLPSFLAAIHVTTAAEREASRLAP